MANKITEYKVFIASPGDLGEEREIVHRICSTLNQSPSLEEREIRLKPMGWEQALPGAGRPQAIINRLQDACDIFVCMFHKRFGTPTGGHGSGTEEEFYNAHEQWMHLGKPRILFYFKSITVTPDDLADPHFQKVMALRGKIEKDEMLLFRLFDTPGEFEAILRDHLEKTALELKKEETAHQSGTGLSRSPHEPARAVVPETYRTWLNDLTRFMDIKELTRGSNVINVKLPEVYQPLFGDDPDAKGRDEDHMAGREPVDIQTVAGRGDSLLVTGAAGCGKTTLARHMARTVLNNASPHFKKETLPVLIYCKDLKRYDFQGKFPNASAAEDILAWFCKNITPGILDMETIRAFCESGRILVILDGLDESGPELREFAAAAFADFKCRCKGLQLVLLGRPHSAVGTVADRFGHRAVTVHDLTRDQAETFIRTWFSHAYGHGPYTGPDLARKMVSEIRARQDIDDMKKNPLMLTAMCILYNDDNVLPDQRADLYNRFVERLLGKFGPDRNAVRQFVMDMAHTMFTAGDRGIDAREAAGILKKYFPPKDGETNQQAFERIEPATGLLEKESGQYKFIHLTFQEFLTARFRFDTLEGDPYDAIAPHAADPRYREVVALFIGLLSLGNSGNANAIVRKLLKQERSGPDAMNWITAAESFLDMHETARNPEVGGPARERMRNVIRSGAEPKVLLAAGEALGRLGYREGYKDFVPIKGGTYDLEEIGKEEILGFEISRYPVTNFWFREFIEAGGYGTESFWTDQGWEWVKDRSVTEPRYFREPRFTCPNSPVVGVSWYEAKAFCNWLTRTCKDGHAYDLPTEIQWQAAAAGREKRTYPWGEGADPSRCNYNDTNLGRPSPSGIFTAGETPDGVHDLAGNVWEWTDSFYDDDKDSYTLRGGSFGGTARNCRCAARLSYYFPSDRGNGAGFRCARIKL